MIMSPLTITKERTSVTEVKAVLISIRIQLGTQKRKKNKIVTFQVVVFI